MDLTVLKEGLLKKDYSFASIADALHLHKGTVSKILNDIYTGKEETKKKVIDYCTALLEDKPINLISDILNKAPLYARLMNEGSLSSNFTPKERAQFLVMHESLDKYSKGKKKNKKAA